MLEFSRIRCRAASIGALLLAATPLMAQTAASSPATAPAPAAAASKPGSSGLSESVLRQAQGPYRMIMNAPTVSPTGPVRARAAVGATARKVEPDAIVDPAPASPVKTATPAATDVPASATAAAPAAALNAPSANLPLQPLAPAVVQAPPTATAIAVPAPLPVTPPPAAVAVAVAVLSAPKPERPLVVLRQEEPVLSAQLKRERPVGSVQVGYNVNLDGTTSDVTVVSSSNRRLNSAVIAAVGKWLYQPLDAPKKVELVIEFTGE